MKPVALLQSNDPDTTLPLLSLICVPSIDARNESDPYNAVLTSFGNPPNVSNLLKKALTELSGLSPTPVV